MKRQGIKRFGLAMCASSLGAIAFASSAHAVKISEVYENGSDEYIELTLEANGETLVGKSLTTFDPAGNVFHDLPFLADRPNMQAQRKILVVDDDYDSTNHGDVASDYADPLPNMFPGPSASACIMQGAVAIDCVVIGEPTIPAVALTSWSGDAALKPDGVDDNTMSLSRSITLGCPTALDAADDTNTAADWVEGTPSPLNNAFVPAEVVCPGVVTPAAVATPVATPVLTPTKKCKKGKKLKKGKCVKKKRKK